MDVGTITNSTGAAMNTYVSKEVKAAESVKKYSVTGKTIGNPRLSEEGKKYYESLKEKYQGMDFILVSSDMKDKVKQNAGKYANPQSMVVLIDEEKIERMATDAEYRQHYEGLIAAAQKKLPELREALGNFGIVKGFGMYLNDNGTASFFVSTQTNAEKQAEKLKERREEKKEAEKLAEKKAEKKAREEKLQEKRAEKKEAAEEIIQADSVEELRKKVEELSYIFMADMVQTEAELHLGTVIDYRG